MIGLKQRLQREVRRLGGDPDNPTLDDAQRAMTAFFAKIKGTPPAGLIEFAQDNALEFFRDDLDVATTALFIRMNQ